MKDLKKRISRIEAYRQDRASKGHWIPILFYPWHLPPDANDIWLVERLACACTPGCPGKRYGALLPEKAPSVEAWAERAQQYYVQKRGSHA